MINEKLLEKELQKYFVNNYIHKNDLAEVIANLPKVGECIPVEKELPNDFERVLTCDECGNIHIMWHHHSYGCPFNIPHNHPNFYPVIKWMSLRDLFRDKVK